jgi:hypothetical protein
MTALTLLTEQLLHTLFYVGLEQHQVGTLCGLDFLPVFIYLMLEMH